MSNVSVSEADIIEVMAGRSVKLHPGDGSEYVLWRNGLMVLLRRIKEADIMQLESLPRVKGSRQLTL